MFIKEKWKVEDKTKFNEYLISLGNKEKVVWTTKIINTKKPLLAIKTPVLKNIAKEISKGNFLSFLDLNINTYYENDVINGNLICKIKEFDLQKKYLGNYILDIDNWSSCDLLSFNIKGREEKYFNLATTYLKSDEPFIRRVGFKIFFEFIDDCYYVDKVFEILNSFGGEKEYYVNMIISWLVCELFIKQREKTLKFLKTNKLNPFQINKAISKCRDSFRVSSEDKETLLSFRK